MKRVFFLCGALALSCGKHDPEVQRVGGPEVEPMSDAMAPDPEGSGATDTATWCQALGVLEASCHRCHGEPQENGAPFPLLTYEHTQAPYYDTDELIFQKMRQRVASDFMPPVTLPADPPVEPLTCEQKTTLLAWLEQGAQPVGGLACLDSDKTLLDCAAGGAGGAGGNAGAGGSPQ